MQRAPLPRRWLTATLLAAATLALAFVVWPYLGSIFWAMVLAIVFEPLQARMLTRLHYRRTSAALATLTIIVIGVGLPFAILATLVARQGMTLYSAVASGSFSPADSLQRVTAVLPHWVVAALEQFGLGGPAEIQAKLSGSAAEAGRFVATHLVRLGVNSLGFALSAAIMLYLLFFLLRDGRAFVERIVRAIPLAPGDKQSLLLSFVTVIRATVRGGIVMAGLQGALGGLVLAALGVTAPVFWGVVFGVTSMLPAVGAGLVWVPIALYFLFTGAFVKAFLLTLFGSVVLTVVDNVVRPLLVGRETHLPGYLVLLSTVGGVASLGLNGVIIGPVAAAMFISTWSLFGTPAVTK